MWSGVISITQRDTINDVAFEPTSTSTPCLSPTPSEDSKSDAQEIEPLQIKESAGFLPIQLKEEVANMITTKLVVHQDPATRKIKPISNIKDFQWHPELLLYMSSIGISQASRIQTVLWPAVLSHHSVVCVGDAKAGRSLGFIIPLLNSLSTFENYPFEPADAPLTLILTLSWKKAENIKYKVMDAVRSASLRLSSKKDDIDDGERICCLAANKDVERQIVVDLANGCHILVATVPCLLRVMEGGKLRLDRCKHLVIDEADEVFERFTEDVREVMRVINLKPKDNSDWPTQVVLNSQRWTDGIQQFVKAYLYRGPVAESSSSEFRSIAGPVVIASGLEMAVYGQVRSRADLFHRSADKITALKRIVKKYGGRKVVILCQDFNSGSEISLELQELEIAHLFVHEELPHYSQKSKELILRWRDRVDTSRSESSFRSFGRRRSKGEAITPCTPLIMTDRACVDAVTDADVLVHYDIPAKSKKQFARRYAHVTDNLVSLYNPKKRGATSYLFLTEEDGPKVKTLIGFLRRSQLGLSKSERRSNYNPVAYGVERLYISRQLDEAVEKIGSPLCNDFKVYGKCQNKATCTHRHFFDKEIEDVSGYLSCDSVVSFRIGHIYSPVHFQVLLDKTSWTNMYNKARLRISLLLGRLSELEPVERHRLQPGLPCLAFYRHKGCFRRAEVLSVMFMNSRDNGEARVLLVDEAAIITVSEAAEALKVLPDDFDFAKHPKQSFEVIVTGLIPHDGDYEWSPIATERTTELLANTLLYDGDLANSSKDQDSWVCKGNVHMNVGDIIWVSDITVYKFMQSLPGSQTSPCGRLKSQILKDGWAEENTEHMNRLAPKARNSGFCVYYKGDMDDNPPYGPIRVSGASIIDVVVPKERMFKEKTEDCYEQQDAVEDAKIAMKSNYEAADLVKDTEIQVEKTKSNKASVNSADDENPGKMSGDKDPGNQADTQPNEFFENQDLEEVVHIREADKFENPTDFWQRGGESVPLPDDSSDLSSVSFSTGVNIKIQQHRFEANVPRIEEPQEHRVETNGENMPTAKPLQKEIVHAISPEPKRLATIELPEDMPSLSIVKGVTNNMEKLSPPKVIWSVRDGQTVLKVSLMKFEQECGRAEYYVRVTRRSVKLQFLTIKRPGVVAEDGDGKDKEIYLYSDMPILWLKSHVKPKETEVTKNGFTLTVTLGKVDSITGSDSNPFCSSLIHVDTPPKHAWLTPDIEAVCDKWSLTNESNHSSGSLLRRRFFEAKLAATPAYMVPNHPAGKMPWEEGGDDGGAFRSSVPVRPGLDTYDGSKSTNNSSFKWANDRYYEEDIDDFVLDWKNKPLELNPDKA